MVAGLTWAVVAVLVLEPHFGSTGFIAPGAYKAYGSSAFSVLGGMLIHPNRVLGDLFAQDNVRLIVALLAPLLFLPILAPRFLIPAVGLTVLFLVADVGVRGSTRNEFALPLTLFAFVAAAFALNRMGRPSIDKILVDRRVLIALTVAAIGFFCIDATNSPYQRPWDWGRENATDHAAHQAVDALGANTPVRASGDIVTLLAERETVFVLDGQPDARAATQGVARVIVDERQVNWTQPQWHEFGAGMATEQFVMVSDVAGVRIYASIKG
jgi:hypothetical protein